MARLKLLVSDMEGTLIDYGAPGWKVVARAIGAEKGMEEIDERRKSKGMTYGEWYREMAGLYKRMGLTRQIMREIFVPYRTASHSDRLFESARRMGMSVAIASGGMRNVYEIKMSEGILADYTKFHSEILFDSGGEISGVRYESEDGQDKLSVIQGLCDELGLEMEKEVAFIGDGSNDVDSMRRASFSIAYRPRKVNVKDAADIAVHGMMQAASALEKESRKRLHM